MKIGDTINGKTILWLDNPSQLIPDRLIKVGELDGTAEYNERCYNCGTNHSKTTKKYKNIKFIRESQL